MMVEGGIEIRVFNPSLEPVRYTEAVCDLVNRARISNVNPRSPERILVVEEGAEVVLRGASRGTVIWSEHSRKLCTDQSNDEVVIEIQLLDLIQRCSACRRCGTCSTLNILCLPGELRARFDELIRVPFEWAREMLLSLFRQEILSRFLLGQPKIGFGHAQRGTFCDPSYLQ